jgi:hypothetical protein
MRTRKIQPLRQSERETIQKILHLIKDRDILSTQALWKHVEGNYTPEEFEVLRKNWRLFKTVVRERYYHWRVERWERKPDALKMPQE